MGAYFSYLWLPNNVLSLGKYYINTLGWFPMLSLGEWQVHATNYRLNPSAGIPLRSHHRYPAGHAAVRLAVCRTAPAAVPCGPG